MVMPVQMMMVMLYNSPKCMMVDSEASFFLLYVFNESKKETILRQNFIVVFTGIFELIFFLTNHQMA